jgi:hypothetical protein
LEEGGPVYGGLHFKWALQVSRDRRAPWLKEVLRERMSTAYQNHLILLRPLGSEIRDDAFDDALLTLAELGGPLSSAEQVYLKQFGYTCEPRKRLDEILEEKRYPK